MRKILFKIFTLFFASILAIWSYFTGETVTFIMLWLILISLYKINSNLKKIVDRLDKKYDER